MKLYFSWGESDGVCSPICSSDTFNADGVNPLACLLSDDGGQPFFETIPWLSKGLADVKQVRESRVDVANWSRDAWWAEIMKKNVKVYSLYDEACFEILSLDSFEAALSTWLNFISTRPVFGIIREVNI